MAHLIRPSVQRLGALVAAGTLTTSGLVASIAAPAHAVPSTDARPVAIGADWLADQLDDGLLPGDFGPLYGQSIDAALSLKAVGGHATAVGTIRDAVAAGVEKDDYITGEAYQDTGSTYAGAVAKALVLAEETGGDATSFGGVDLVARLEAQVSGSAPTVGRLGDTSQFGDFANTLGQAFAARGLSAAPSASKAADVVSFLLLQQCSAGYFRQEFAATDDLDQSCDAGIAGGHSKPSVDATAIATQQLQAIATPSQAVSDAIADAVAWLLAHQHADGSFSADELLGPNSDTTGVAAQVLADAGEDAAATRAAAWIRAHQADERAACPNALSGETGAVGYDDDAVSAGLSDGTGQQWLIATAQALPALALAPAAASPLALDGPTDYVKANRGAVFRVSGAAAGDKVCVSGIGAAHRVVAPTSGAFAVTLAVPSRTATRIATATVHGAADSLRVEVLGKKDLTVKPARRTKHRGTKVRVVVTGLAPAERVRLRVRGVTRATGIADPSGRFTRLVKVGHRLGKARIAAWGQFSTIRNGHTTIRVVR